MLDVFLVLLSRLLLGVVLGLFRFGGTLMELVEIVSQIGFPMAVASWCLFRMDRTVQANTEALHELMLVLKER